MAWRERERVTRGKVQRHGGEERMKDRMAI
jgi:hypothetical protein